MAFVQLDNISLAFGDRDILKNVNFMISTGSRIALSGANGSGKTTLMKIISGESECDGGKVIASRESRIAYLPQSGIEHKGSTLKAEAEKAFSWIGSMLEDVDRLGKELQEHKTGKRAENLLHRHHELQEQILESGYYGREEQITRILQGLGFSMEDMDRECSQFSGGWQMRIALAKELLKNPDILLLDEPTNYLDLEAREWLRDFLGTFKGGILIVSHDRFFLDAVVNEVAELFLGDLKIYKGNYSSYEKKRKEELKTLVELYKKQQEEIARNEDFIRRFRYQATKASAVQSRVNMLERMERIEIPENLKKIHFSFPAPPHSGKKMLTLEGIRKSYGDREVLKGIDHLIQKGDKLVITGLNGAGKSTLLRILSGTDTDFEGTLTPGTDVKIGYFSQDQEEVLDKSNTVLEELESDAPTEMIPNLRGMLGAFLFSGDDIFKSVSVLSGGEKNRLALLKLLLRPVNLLILDEPTNHLDIHSKDVLLDALKSYSGTVIFVSHDRYFIEELAENVLELTSEGHRLYQGNYEYYLWKKANEGTDEIDAPASGREADEDTPVQSAKLSREEDKKLKAQIRRLKREEEELLGRLAELEEEHTELSASLATPEIYSDGEKAKEVSDAMKANEEEQEKISRQWETVEEQLSELDTQE
ncbi:ABC-F family ATP-binding cassette domain-containing protein [Spirochaeta isovalerica]|uniref:ATP-binding cassette subfamily F protein 3 n=1 Tax=Spirochaeta isovalerica TaxID=150 RepID=A0A841RGH7_9SPIO|nr:ABC-F family ATP-binding cassette domain-containing protein [Spirochaeta isovalerica]MBB6481628.1 ATP-binding cassette subfamily F protein 3 [Spirochaeta isovalerica]